MLEKKVSKAGLLGVELHCSLTRVCWASGW